MHTKAELILFAALLSNSAFAMNCFDIEDYTNYSSYHEYNLVQRRGKVYECKVAGWCKQGGPYTPGIGWAWNQAWEELGHCHQKHHFPNVSHEKFCIGQHYAVGDTVFYRGYLYECKVEGWCSSAAAAYEPGEGEAWFDAWRPVRNN